MSRPLPHGAAVVVLGPSASALGRLVAGLLPGATLHGPRDRPGDWDIAYERAVAHVAALFAGGTPIVGICASGILIRAIAPALADKRSEPAVVALAEDGSVAVPLLGGHHGANAIARALADALGAVAAVTTAGDVRLGIALDEPPAGWRIANPERVKPVVAALLAGEPVALIEEACAAEWLRAGNISWTEAAPTRVVVADRAQPHAPAALVYHPPVLAVGIGCERDCPPEEIEALAHETLAQAGLSPMAVAAVVSVALKTGESGIHALAAKWGVPARFFPSETLLAETERLTIRSDAAFRAAGCWGVAEGAALAATGPKGELIVPRRQSRRATCAVARAPTPLDPSMLGRGRGHLAVVGIGPGDPLWRTPEASEFLAAASDVVGYRLYLDLLGGVIAGKTRHQGTLGAESDRVRLALDLAAAGRRVALVSSGDAGIYGLATLVFELLDRERRRDWDAVEIAVAPGVSALQAASARVGAPLGHDFCAISLSDLMTPWPAICARLEAAAAADFVVALYNPRSHRRAGQLIEAAGILAACRPPETPVVIARNLGRAGETSRIVTLAELADAAEAVDMLTLVLVGNSRTRLTAGNPPRLYTPRGYGEAGRCQVDPR